MATKRANIKHRKMDPLLLEVRVGMGICPGEKGEWELQKDEEKKEEEEEGRRSQRPRGAEAEKEEEGGF
uniref:Uncharacterized protein n=1 Tax=Pristionchus pacificus TaxID=54126 RepID=A0A2A6BHY1_PRIPA|eukprot:PDM65499.1 hypothetical protein PRIPAC_52441 [Pristionchus pacificus]